MNTHHQMDQQTLKKLQSTILEMLIEIDRICRKHAISYSLDGGTLLGAVRHKGFIPWDDDGDVIMLRSEYEKFRAACELDLDCERFFLQDYTTDPEYRWGYAKLRRNGTELIREGQEFMKQRTGIFVDIFVVDNVPDNYFIRRIHYAVCFLIRKTLYAPVGERNTNSLALKVVFKLLSKVPRNAVFALRNALAAASNRKKTTLISHYTMHYPKRCRYGLPAVCFASMQDIAFCDHVFLAFEKYDLYLSNLYGEYRKLPPKEQQFPHNTASVLRFIEDK